MADRKIFANQGPTNPDVPKSAFDLSHTNNGTYRFGRLYPILCYEAPAGSSFRIKPYVGFDMHPLAFPIQSNVRCHMSFYKVPFRILWKHYKDFFGQHAADGSIANADSMYKIPYISRTDNWHDVGSLADYFGIPSQAISIDTETSYTVRSCVSSLFPAKSVIDKNTLSDSADDGRSFGKRFFFYNDNNHLSYRGMFYLLPITNFDGTTIAFDFYSANNNLQISDFLGTQITDNNRMCVYCAPCNIDRTSYTIVPVGSTIHHRESASGFDTCQFIHRTDVALTSAQVGSLNRYRFTITLSASMQAAMKLSPNVAFGVCFNNSLFPSVVEDSTSFSNLNTTPISILHNKVEEEGGIIYAELTPGFSGLGFSGIYQRKFTVGQDSAYMFRANNQDINGGKPYIPISALPFRAYEFIYNYFFRNERLYPFQKNGIPTYNDYLTNDGDDADSSTPVDFKHVPYEYDLFTTCVRTPQFGNAPLVGITTNGNSATFIMQDVSVTDPDSHATDNYFINCETESGKIVQITNYNDVADKPAVKRLREAISMGISINDFRNVNCLQRLQERYQKAGNKYVNLTKEFYGTTPPIGEEFPEYIGGNTSMINVSKVVSTADAGEKGLGGYVGNGSFASKGQSIRCFCAEQSYIIGLMYFTCTPTYSQMLPRHFSKRELLDFYNPQFANIGLQPVYRHQLAPLQLQTSEVGEVFGYNRPFAEYVSMQDEAHGDFRTSMSNYLLQRVFASKPELGKQFCEIDSKDLTNVFLDMNDDDKIFGQIYFDMRAKLPIPRFAVPRII